MWFVIICESMFLFPKKITVANIVACSLAMFGEFSSLSDGVSFFPRLKCFHRVLSTRDVESSSKLSRTGSFNVCFTRRSVRVPVVHIYNRTDCSLYYKTYSILFSKCRLLYTYAKFSSTGDIGRVKYWNCFRKIVVIIRFSITPSLLYHQSNIFWHN